MKYNLSFNRKFPTSYTISGNIIITKQSHKDLGVTLSDKFGFLPGRSTLQQLLLFINELLEAKRTNKVSDVIYLDFKKAFDSINHTKLLHKIRSFGITGTLFNWFVTYLSNRVQYV